MTKANTSPKWWQLYLAFPLLITLFILDAHLKISTRGHQVVQIGIILFVYGLVFMWVNANTAALLRMDRSKYCGVIRFSAPANNEPNSLLELSDLEIMGISSYTFEGNTSIWRV